jgi:heme/copper-type cytochrome/quinol oxidase subunit 2
VIWTVGPVIVLLMIAVPSFQLLTAQYTPAEEPEITIKATGNCSGSGSTSTRIRGASPSPR